MDRKDKSLSISRLLFRAREICEKEKYLREGKNNESKTGEV